MKFYINYKYGFKENSSTVCVLFYLFKKITSYKKKASEIPSFFEMKTMRERGVRRKARSHMAIGKKPTTKN